MRISLLPLLRFSTAFLVSSEFADNGSLSDRRPPCLHCESGPACRMLAQRGIMSAAVNHLTIRDSVCDLLSTHLLSQSGGSVSQGLGRTLNSCSSGRRGGTWIWGWLFRRHPLTFFCIQRGRQPIQCSRPNRTLAGVGRPQFGGGDSVEDRLCWPPKTLSFPHCFDRGPPPAAGVLPPLRRWNVQRPSNIGKEE